MGTRNQSKRVVLRASNTGALCCWALAWLLLGGCGEIRERFIFLSCDASAGPDASGPVRPDGGGDGDDIDDVEAGLRDGQSDSETPEPLPQGDCPPLASRTLVDVAGGVLEGEQVDWTCDNIYVLNGVVFVHSGEPGNPQVLRIQAGTEVRGQVTSNARGFLVITRTGRIEARGTREEPIVFTSANPLGFRARDDWGGLTMLGAASTGGTRRVEGYPATVEGQNIDAYLAYGPFPQELDAGTDASVEDDDGGADASIETDASTGTGVVGTGAALKTQAKLLAASPAALAPSDDHDCGTLTFVRVEFASFNAGGGDGNESNGIQLYACGHNTSFDHVHVHRSGDDGVEVFGGTVDLRHLLVTGASDDGLDWDDGWRGRAQYVIVQQYPDAADLGFEAGGSGDTPAVAPEARIFNATWIGTGDSSVGGVGGRLRGSSFGLLSNQIFMGFNPGALDVGGAIAAQHVRSGTLAVRNSVFWPTSDGDTFPSGTGDAPDDALDEQSEFVTKSGTNRIADPMLKAPFDLAKPNFAPRFQAMLGANFAETPSEADDDPRPPFFDVDARYVGALEPQGTDWTAGWTAFSAN